MNQKERILTRLEHRIEAFAGIFVTLAFFEIVFVICKHTAGSLVIFAGMIIAGFACKALANIREDIERWD